MSGKAPKTELLHAPKKQRSTSKGSKGFKGFQTIRGFNSSDWCNLWPERLAILDKINRRDKETQTKEVEETLHVLKDLNEEIRRDPVI